MQCEKRMVFAMAHIEVSTIIPFSRGEVFDYACDPNNMPEILKPNIDVIVETPQIPLKKGSEFIFTMSRYGLSQRVTLRVEDYVRGSRLSYKQVNGLFATWNHVIRCEDHGGHETLLTDIVDYSVPMGLLGFLADDLFVKRDMEHILESRQQVIQMYFSKDEPTS